MKYTKVKMTEAEFKDHCEDYTGIWMNCHEIPYGTTEPDAEGYYCEDGEQDKVMGIEQALFLGKIEIDD